MLDGSGTARQRVGTDGGLRLIREIALVSSKRSGGYRGTLPSHEECTREARGVEPGVSRKDKLC